MQVVPAIIGEMMSDPDPVKSERVMQALLQMKKLDIAGLKKAYEKDKAALANPGATRDFMDTFWTLAAFRT